jgi:hypothetical protein
MWNENAPMELLKDLPRVLNEANLARLQSVIDSDKYVNSEEYGYDLCGSYAPFCSECKKQGNTPCAVTYVQMMQKQGMDVEIEGEKKEETEVKKKTTRRSSTKTTESGPIRIAVAKRKK